ncbi:AzlD domain-containing protein [Flexibacterium corallicola]|uniref:AzlD domain-containing protein n=1 Tax=Flexibacterium corallicola TaxID=3037259 RepID=UPI00286F88FC|nr:AzlD domain-containing protein [Pseudovibrio sp. M1P-2-3]
MIAETSQLWWWPYLIIVVAGWLATDVWRWLGVFAAGRLHEESQVFLWVRAVATALIAGIIARLILFPTGVLSEAPMLVRIVAAALGFLAFNISGGRLLVGIVTAETTLLAGWYFLG